MKLIRSWPLNPPDIHPRIVDNSEKVYIPTVDFRPLAGMNDNFIHLDWDIAVDRDELRDFAVKCKAEPDLVRVAPYKEHVTRYRHDHMTVATKTQWLVWLIDETGRRVPINPGDPVCNLFGFGFVYFPAWTMKGYVATGPDVGTDIGFSHWYWNETGKYVPVEWGVRVIHVNYSIKDALNGL